MNYESHLLRNFHKGRSTFLPIKSRSLTHFQNLLCFSTSKWHSNIFCPLESSSLWWQGTLLLLLMCLHKQGWSLRGSTSLANHLTDELACSLHSTCGGTAVKWQISWDHQLLPITEPQLRYLFPLDFLLTAVTRKATWSYTKIDKQMLFEDTDCHKDYWRNST